MAASFAHVPTALAHQLETSSERFKAFLHSLERPDEAFPDPEPASRTREIQSYLQEVRLWPNQFVYVHDVESGRFYHRGLSRTLGYDLDRVTPDFFVETIHPADLPMYLAVSQALLSFVMRYSPALIPFESTCHVNYRMRRADGSYASILRKSTPFLKDEEEQVAVYISRCTDISPISDDPEVRYEVFGPKSKHFEAFLDAPSAKEPAEDLFTEREMDVLRLLRAGLTSPEIADKLFISVNTVNTHRKSLMRKAEVNNTVSLLFFAQEHGYL